MKLKKSIEGVLREYLLNARKGFIDLHNFAIVNEILAAEQQRT